MKDTKIMDMTKALALDEMDLIAGGTEAENWEIIKKFKMESQGLCLMAAGVLLYISCNVNAYLYNEDDKPNLYCDVDSDRIFTHEEIMAMLRAGGRENYEKFNA